MRLIGFCAGLAVVLGVSFVDAQDEYSSATLNERRAALFSASRSKMFDPSANWADARTTVGQRAGSSDAGGGQMLETMGQSSTLETIRQNPMNMFLTTGRIQGLMALDTQNETEIIDSREGADLTGLTSDDVNAGRTATMINSTGIYSPRFVRPDSNHQQIRFRNQKHLQNDILIREKALSDRLNEKFNLTGDTQIKLTIAQDGVAFLQGTVDNKEQYKIAEIFIGFEPGINEVRNELEIHSP